MVWLVDILVDQRMVQGAMYPINAVVGEDQETMTSMSEKGPRGTSDSVAHNGIENIK